MIEKMIQMKISTLQYERFLHNIYSSEIYVFVEFTLKTLEILTFQSNYISSIETLDQLYEPISAAWCPEVTDFIKLPFTCTDFSKWKKNQIIFSKDSKKACGILWTITYDEDLQDHVCTFIMNDFSAKRQEENAR
jgi:hypothetical protein